MDTNELKAAIERVQKASFFLPNTYDTDLTTVLALAEIGRLAVEESGRVVAVVSTGTNEAHVAAVAFLAARKGGE